MTITGSAAWTAVPGRTAHPAGRRPELLLFAIASTSLAAVGLSLYSFLEPVGDANALPAYTDIAPVRSSMWLFFTAGGVNLVVGVCSVAVAGWVLASRGPGVRWATGGGVLMWLGAALYGVGAGGWAAAYYFATDPAVLGPEVSTALVDHVNDDPRLLAAPLGGALLVGLGSLGLAAGLWRARTVPRWLPVTGALASLGVLIAAPSTLTGLVLETVSAITSIVLGWYAWRLLTTRAPGGDREPARRTVDA